jgi:hypothetical protein
MTDANMFPVFGSVGPPRRCESPNERWRVRGEEYRVARYG